MRRLQQLCQDRPDVLDLIDQARQRGEVKGKRNDLVYNVHDVAERPAGNSTEAALRRLRKDRPDLHQRVVAGELSANAAMIAAGYYKQ